MVFTYQILVFFFKTVSKFNLGKVRIHAIKQCSSISNWYDEMNVQNRTYIDNSEERQVIMLRVYVYISFSKQLDNEIHSVWCFIVRECLLVVYKYCHLVWSDYTFKISLYPRTCQCGDKYYKNCFYFALHFTLYL